MSALLAPAWREERSAGDRLRVVPTPPARLARFPFLLVLIGLFAVGMTGLLMLNTSLQNQAFQARSLDREATALAYQQAALESQLDELNAPAELARRASALGMRPDSQPAFLVLPGGKVIGEARRVSGRDAPELVIKTPTELAAEAAAAEAKRTAELAARAAAAKKAAELQRQQAEARKKAEEAAQQATAKKKQQAGH
jgi:hypothetical protein